MAPVEARPMRSVVMGFTILFASAIAGCNNVGSFYPVVGQVAHTPPPTAPPQSVCRHRTDATRQDAPVTVR